MALHSRTTNGAV